jgi:hypothetical protein
MLAVCVEWCEFPVMESDFRVADGGDFALEVGESGR